MPWLQAKGIDRTDIEGTRAVLPEAIRKIGDIGFSGFEASLTALPLEDPAEIKEVMARSSGMRLAGAHSGAAWCEPSAERSILEIVGRVRLLPSLGCHRLIVSLFPRPEGVGTPEQLECGVRLLGMLGRLCREEVGVEVLFHNHPWEMAVDARFLQLLLDACPPEDLNLAPDLGWVAIGGMPPEAFITRFGSRIKYIHTRGVTELGAGGRTLETGRGVLQYRGIADALEGAGFQGWLIAESEYRPPWAGNDDPDASARLHMNGLTAALRQPPS